MTVDRAALAASLRPEVDVTGGDDRLAERLAGWLDGIADGGAPPRAEMDALCRQIDVRHRLAERYEDGWKAAADGAPATATTVAGVAATLLAEADRTGGSDPWRLKAVNSVLKCLDLAPDVPRSAALRAWAFEILDDATAPEAR